MNIVEQNLLLAKFMGAETERHYLVTYNASKCNSNPQGKFLIEMKYDRDWSELMPVVEKIENIRIPDNENSMRFDVKIKHHSCRINDWHSEGENFIHVGGCASKILAVHCACVLFVEWYNKNCN